MKLNEIVFSNIAIHHKSKLLLILFILPLLYGILFGFAYRSNVVKYVPTIIYDQDHTATSRALIQAYVDSERYKVIGEVPTQEMMEHTIRNNGALTAISIPADFSRNIKLGLASQVLVTVNSTNTMFANAVITSSQEIVQTFSAATAQKLLEAGNQMPKQALRTVAPIKIGTRIVNNSTTSYTNFMLPGLVMNGLQIAILLVAGTGIAVEYKRLSCWQGTSSSAIVIGKMLACWLYAISAYILTIGLIVGLFSVPQKGNVFYLVILGCAFTFLLINLCFFFSAVTGNEVLALQVPLLYIMPGLLFSGLSWPYFAMNEFSRFFSALMPLTYMADTLRDLLLSGSSPALLKNIAIMFAGGTFFILLTIQIFSFRRRQPQIKDTKGEVL